MTNPRSPRRGVTLIEILCVMVLLAVVTTVLMALINHMLEAQRIQASSYDRLHQSKALADQFRLDVARARKTLDQRGAHVAGPDTLILQLDDDSTIVYTTIEKRLVRVTSEQEEELERPVPLPDGTSIEFVRTDRMIQARLTPTKQGKALVGQSLEIAAALAGDWR